MIVAKICHSAIHDNGDNQSQVVGTRGSLEPPSRNLQCPRKGGTPECAKSKPVERTLSSQNSAGISRPDNQAVSVRLKESAQGARLDVLDRKAKLIGMDALAKTETTKIVPPETPEQQARAREALAKWTTFAPKPENFRGRDL